MSKESLLKWLPYVLFYILIFRDPYSAIIPVSEPALTYSPETTWLLDGTTNETDFATAYNRHFKDLLQDERNAFPYFLKAVQDDGYTPSGKAILNSFTAKGDNVTVIPIPGPDSPLRKVPEKQADAKKNLAAMMKDDKQSELFQIMDRINLPPGIDHYEEPLLSDPEDMNQLALLLERYIINLSSYGKNASRTGKALTHLRLLANTSDLGRLLLAVTGYRYLVNHGPLETEEIRRLEKDMPPWPNAKSLITRLHRASVTQYMTSSNQWLRDAISRIRKKDSDFFLDRNELLQTVNQYITAMDTELPDKPLDQACDVRSKISSIAAAFDAGQDKRPLAEKMLFSGSIREEHRRAARFIGGKICARQAELLYAAMDSLAKVHEPITKDPKPNGP